MAIHGCKCTLPDGSVYFGSHTSIIEADIINHKFEAISYGRRRSGEMIHFSTHKTHHPLYKTEVSKLKGKPRGAFFIGLYYIEWYLYSLKVQTQAYAKAIMNRIKRVKNR